MPRNSLFPRRNKGVDALYPTVYNTGMTNNENNAKGTTMIATRAKRGGEIGKNGEFYAGGTFLPSTTLGKMQKAKAVGSGKVEVEPFKWVASEGRKSLYKAFAGVFGVVGRDGIATMTANAGTLAYYRTSRDEAQEMIDRYNAGERWL